MHPVHHCYNFIPLCQPNIISFDIPFHVNALEPHRHEVHEPCLYICLHVRMSYHMYGILNVSCVKSKFSLKVLTNWSSLPLDGYNKDRDSWEATATGLLHGGESAFVCLDQLLIDQWREASTFTNWLSIYCSVWDKCMSQAKLAHNVLDSSTWCKIQTL